MRAVDIGTRRVIHLNESSSVAEAARTMHEHDVGCVVVVRSTPAGIVPCGVVTDRDLVTRIMSEGGGGEGEAKTLLDIQSLPLATCRPETTIDELIAIMLGSHVRRLPIVDDEGQLIGIVCLDDVMAALAELMRRASIASTGERALD